jgi:sigma-E factor negative regulatory protein RseB
VRRHVPAAGAAVVLGSLVLLLLLFVAEDEAPRPPGQAGGSDGSQQSPVVEDAALRLLYRAAVAPSTAAYDGTEFVSAWSSGGATSRLLEVSHTPEAGTTWRAGGHATPGSTVARTAASTADPSILSGSAVALLSSHYSLSTAGQARVAGRSVDVVEARRPSAGSRAAPAARFWLDRATGLVLRREVYDEKGDPVRASAFIDVTVRESAGSDGSAVSDAAATDAAGDRAWSTTLDDTAVKRMRSHGWDCPSSLPGPLPLVDARRGGADRRIVHLSYADGIASISVFQQRGTLDGSALKGYRKEALAGDGDQVVWVRAEVPRRVVWSTGGTVFTVVADAPERTVDRAVVALHAAADQRAGGTMDRLGRGLDRVGSWFNPFE